MASYINRLHYPAQEQSKDVWSEDQKLSPKKSNPTNLVCGIQTYSLLVGETPQSEKGNSDTVPVQTVE